MSGGDVKRIRDPATPDQSKIFVHHRLIEGDELESGMDFKQLYKKYEWREIHGCSGRYVLKGGPSRISPRELTGCRVSAKIGPFSATGDPVFITAFQGGGLISWQKRDGRFIHTLCTQEGFKKKLQALYIEDVDRQE